LNNQVLRLESNQDRDVGVRVRGVVSTFANKKRATTSQECEAVPRRARNVRLIDFLCHSSLSSTVIKKKKKLRGVVWTFANEHERWGRLEDKVGR